MDVVAAKVRVPGGGGARRAGRMIQPPVDYIERTREQYSALGYPVYRWVEETEPPAFTRVDKPTPEWRVGLVASGGIYVQGQIAFHHRDDVSYREIDVDTSVERLRATHFAYDLTDARADPNVVFPLETLRYLRDREEIGALAPLAYTFMGGIYSVRKVRDVLAPALAERLVSDCVDVAVMVPV
ncbi:MAG: hypothetical protein F4X36_02025 [Gammaproteobacteria bacterium]|nr:hypothetical protein [Gammaproteobacteria bacterium]